MYTVVERTERNMKPNAVIFDMDGTLADVSGIRHHVMGGKQNFDAFHAASIDVPPIQQAVDLAHQARADGHAVIVVTARRAKWRSLTSFWLAMHEIPSDALFMRHDFDERCDAEVKKDILDRIRLRWTPVLAVDDRPTVCAMWRSQGIPTVVIPGWLE
jgi:phosphoglycolate phosphatase-like HAD superfamily hydrolase